MKPYILIMLFFTLIAFTAKATEGNPPFEIELFCEMKNENKYDNYEQRAIELAKQID